MSYVIYVNVVLIKLVLNLLLYMYRSVVEKNQHTISYLICSLSDFVGQFMFQFFMIGDGKSEAGGVISYLWHHRK